MSAFPVRPRGEDEHAWFRRLEKDLALSVISADPEESACAGCDQKRVIYQAQIYPERTIIARCKDCLLARAGEPERLWVRTDAYLRQKWTRDAKNPAFRERAKKRPRREVDGGTGRRHEHG